MKYMKIKTSSNEIKKLLERGVDEIIDKKNLEKKLKSGRRLRIKLGIDPTSPNIHLGRSIPLLKLRDFENLGHKIIFIIGDFTGLIGDTSDKESERPMLSEDVIEKNLKTYIEQASKIINIKKAETCHNSKWLASLNYMDIGRQADIFSLNEFISRENISKRLKKGKRVSLRELLYPMMQGYDSVKIKADVEVGGTDQRFNLLAGRDMQRFYRQEPQDIITNPLIEGLDGRKMSSSFGNTVNLFDLPNDMFGKIMSLRDDFIIKYFTLLTRVDEEIINDYRKELKEGKNPRDIKMNLAFEIVKIYHSKEDAKKSKDYFIKTFSKKEIPSEIKEIQIKEKKLSILDLVEKSGLSSSKNEAKRLILQKGIKINGKVEDNWQKEIEIKKGTIIQAGKRRFLKIN